MYKVVQYDNNNEEITSTCFKSYNDAIIEFTNIVGQQLTHKMRGYSVDVFKYNAAGDMMLGLVCEHNTEWSW